MERDLSRALAAGAFYFAIVFAAGFALGALRVTLLAPRFGETGAVLAELPVMLAIAWAACGAAVGRFGVPARVGPQAVTGGLAFGLLMLAELGLAATFGETPGAWLAGLAEAPGALGLAGQVLFGLMPLLRGRR